MPFGNVGAMSKQRLLEIAENLTDLADLLGESLVRAYADDIREVAQTLPDPESPDDVCTECGLKRRTHPVECCTGFTADA